MKDYFEILIPGLILGVIIGLILRFRKSYLARKKDLKGEERVEAIETIIKLRNENKGFHVILSTLMGMGIMKTVAERLIIEADNRLQGKSKDPETEIAEEQKFLSETKITPEIQYYISSHKNFKAGSLNFVSTIYQTEAETTALGKFIELYSKQEAFQGFAELAQSFPPSKNEYMIAFKTNDFLLTNKRLILHNREEKDSKDWIAINHQEIKSYKTKGWWTCSVTIELKSGETKSMENFENYAEEAVVNKLLQRKIYEDE